MKFRKGDKVRVTAGKEKGRDGAIEKIYHKADTVLLPGINIYKKHVKKNEQMPQGGVVELPRPLASSKVAFLCPKCGKVSRLGYQMKGTKKQRICKKCQSVV